MYLRHEELIGIIRIVIRDDTIPEILYNTVRTFFTMRRNYDFFTMRRNYDQRIC